MPYRYAPCHVCGGLVAEQLTEQTVRDGGAWLVVRGVPTGVCTRCGEQVFRWQATERLEQIVAERDAQRPAGQITVPVFHF